MALVGEDTPELTEIFGTFFSQRLICSDEYVCIGSDLTSRINLLYFEVKFAVIVLIEVSCGLEYQIHLWNDHTHLIDTFFIIEQIHKDHKCNERLTTTGSNLNHTFTISQHIICSIYLIISRFLCTVFKQVIHT